jgi:hypothetical protein
MALRSTGNYGCLIIMYYLIGIIMVISAFYFNLVYGVLSLIAYIGIGRLYENWMGKAFNKDEEDNLA